MVSFPIENEALWVGKKGEMDAKEGDNKYPLFPKMYLKWMQQSFNIKMPK